MDVTFLLKLTKFEAIMSQENTVFFNLYYPAYSIIINNMAALSDWVYSEICKFLGPDTPRAYTDYILEIPDQEDLREYLLQLCGDGKEEEIQSFVDVLMAKKDVKQENVIVYKKGSDDPSEQRSVRPKKKKEQKKVVTLDDIAPDPVAKTPLDSAPAVKKKSISPSKKKTTYVSLYGKDGEARSNAVLLPGRNVCECQAQKHRLINNCLSCGRVVCEQEGSGPCLFCGVMVCTPEEKKILARESNKSEKLLKKLESVGGGGALAENQDGNKGLQKAEDYKNRLLEYDRTYVQRTKVIDDESDYYASDANIWLSPKEREAMKKKEEQMREQKFGSFGSRLNRKVTLDFAGRRIIDEERQLPTGYQDPTSHVEERPSTNPALQENFPELPMPKFINKENKKPSKNGEERTKNTKRVPSSGRVGRLQDKQLQQMSDLGMCLSMHQPWASLLVRGIKKHEGRSWYSNHRGRLWIAAASQKPTSEEIAAVERQHQEYVDSDVEFPSEYPTSCLLGCVNVDEVLSQEDYRVLYPRGESGSPYVFVCSGFEELMLKTPISGQHKIWKLPTQIHQAAKKGRTVQHDGFYVAKFLAKLSN